MSITDIFPTKNPYLIDTHDPHQLSTIVRAHLHHFFAQHPRRLAWAYFRAPGIVGIPTVDAIRLNLDGSLHIDRSSFLPLLGKIHTSVTRYPSCVYLRDITAVYLQLCGTSTQEGGLEHLASGTRIGHYNGCNPLPFTNIRTTSPPKSA